MDDGQHYQPGDDSETSGERETHAEILLHRVFQAQSINLPKNLDRTKLTSQGEKFSVGRRADADGLFEAAQKMALVSEAARKGYFRQREIIVGQEGERFFDPDFSDVLAVRAIEMFGKIS